MKRLTDEQLIKMMEFIMDFMTCVKVAHMKGMAEIIQEAVKYLKDQGLTHEEFAEEVKLRSRGKAIPNDDLFYTNLKKGF